MLGTILIYLLVFTTFSSSLFYFISAKDKRFLTLARYAYLFSCGIIIFVSGHFMSIILAHDYSYTYIFNYSNNDLPMHLLISSFFAGQEGSFLLWALLSAIVGIIILPQSRKYNMENVVMGFYSLLFLFLVVMLVAKSPFTQIWETYPNDLTPNSLMPSDGRGMNPILESFWMTIHPPILFIGYATMAVPFVFALSGLVRKDYTSWLKPAYQWSLVTSGILGLGIMLGGFWAYETLGWGGFWGWDPVENSSLMPWIVINAFIHTLLVQHRTGGLVKVNFFMAVLSFVLVIYATFLTRSGVLGDTSVHSFIDPGAFAYFLLLIFLLLFLFLGTFLIILRAKDINKTLNNASLNDENNKEGGFELSSREYFISIGVVFLMASTVIIFIGTSFPIFMDILGKEKTAVEISFYNKWNLPIVFGILLLNGFTLYTNWKKTGFKKTMWRIIASAVISFILVIILSILGINEFRFQLLAYSVIFSIIINAEFLVRNFGFKVSKLGSYISHIGFALMILGVIGNAVFSSSKTLELELNTPVRGWEYTFEFVSKTEIDKHRKDQEKYKYNVNISDGKSNTLASPVIYWSSFNDFSTPFFEPGIVGGLSEDLYLEPKTVDFKEFGDEIRALPDEINRIPHDTDVSIVFKGLDMSQMQTMQNHQHMIIGAVVDITLEKTYTDTLYAIIDPQNNKNTIAWQEIPGKEYQIGFKDINVSEEIEKSDISLAFAREVFICKVSRESYMSLVWIGSLSAIIGFFFPLFKKKKK
jgi:cytochrome c-type biogenesis protein CcmF